MIRQGLLQKMQQKLSPQQIQFIKLLQLPTAQLEARIEQELEANPALEEGLMADQADNEREERLENEDYEQASDSEKLDEAADLSEDFGEDDYDYRTRQKSDPNQEHYEAPVVNTYSLHDQLHEQLTMLNLDDTGQIVAENIIGNIDEDGYLRRDLFALVDDLVFKYNVNVEPAYVEEMLSEIQQFDPPGVAARDLQECLLLQIDRKKRDPITRLAERIVMDCFEEFTKKHFSKIINKLDISEDDFKIAYEFITRLNPKPGESSAGAGTAQYIIPDFIIDIKDRELSVKLNQRNTPELGVSKQYLKMLKEFEQQEMDSRSKKDTLQFVKTKVDSAKWFIDAIRQRQYTLLKTMISIAEKQKAFFLSEGNERELKPMILKDVAEDIEMDISTVSRVANSKYVQTYFGIYPLKFFFSEGITNEAGEEVSNREVKRILSEAIEAEDKQKPLSDQKLADLLKEQGYPIARRTVAKYREQMNLPVARLRKEL
ncbi:MAG: RNA polymerase factor sigma-54 [Bacteroidota bacterium]